jgi:hypothetical protein
MPDDAPVIRAVPNFVWFVMVLVLLAEVFSERSKGIDRIVVVLNVIYTTF